MEKRRVITKMQKNNLNQSSAQVTFSNPTQLVKLNLPDACAEYLNNFYGRMIFWLGLS
jgi:hypothetical protein